MSHKLLPTNPPLSDGFSLRPRRAEAEKQRQEASHARWAACQDHKTWLAEKTWRKQVRFLPAVWMEVLLQVLPGLMYRYWSYLGIYHHIFSRTNKKKIYKSIIMEKGGPRVDQKKSVPFTWVSGIFWNSFWHIFWHSFWSRKEEEWGDSTKSQGGRCCRRSQESRGGKTTKLRRPTVNESKGKKDVFFLHP